MIIKEFKVSDEGVDVLLISGVHGNEITPICCLQLIRYKCEEESFLEELGSVVRKLTLVIGANVGALRECTREYIPNNNGDLNRMFPSLEINPMEKLKILINDHNIIIDIHSSPYCAEVVLIDVNEYMNYFINWCKAADVKWCCWTSPGDTIKKYALDQQKRAITLELRDTNVVNDESAEQGVIIIKKLLNSKYYEKTFLKSDLIFNIGLQHVKVELEGLYISKSSVGNMVKKDQLLGEIISLDYQQKQDIKSPCDGYFMEEPDRSYVKLGYSVVGVQPNY